MQRRLSVPARRPVLAAALAAAALMAPVATPQPTPDNVFGEVIDVRVVNLEVVVTEGGRRLSGLGPADFVLKVDGQEVPIEYFTEVHGGTAAVPSAEESLGTVPALAPGAPAPTSYLVFVDEFFAIAPQRNRVLRRMIEQLPMLNPEDRMAVVAYNGRKLDMLSTWSQSVEALTRVFEEALERPTFGAHRLNSRRLFAPDRAAQDSLSGRRAEFEQPELLGAGVRVGSAQLTIEEEQLAGLLEDDVKRTVMAAASTLRSFANPPGRKVMLMLAGGWPYTPAQWVVSDPTRAIYTTGFAYGDNLYAPLIETANRLSYTLYPVDVPVQPDSTIDASAAEADLPIGVPPEAGAASDPFSAGSSGQVVRAFLDNVRDQRTSLRRLAWDTGGRAIFAGDTLRALENVVADTRSYYWIGFTPKWQGDDAAHKVDVDVRRRGLRVRTRQSFSDLSRQREVTMMVESALRLGDAPTTTPMPAKIGEIKKAGRGKVEVPVQLLIPMAALTFLPHENHYVAQAELRVAAQDDAGSLADIPVVPLTITLDAPPQKDDMRRWETRLTLRKERHDVVVSLYDNGSGTILSTKLEVNPL